MLRVAEVHRSLLRRSVVITGAPRSGTTLLGKIISSLDKLEYQFEPPTFYMIAASFAAGEIPLRVASNLLSVYLTEDLLLESMHGRNANLRPDDDSLILNRMSWPELTRRWQLVKSRLHAIAMIEKEGRRLAIKMPNVFDGIDLVQEVIPELRLIVAVRDGNDVVQSIIRKGWVSNAGLNNDLWPYMEQQDVALNTPYWVPTEYIRRWPSMNVESRACLMWTHHAELAKRYVEKQPHPGAHIEVVRYEDVVAQPWEVVERLAAAIDANPTVLTQRCVDAIREYERDRNAATFHSSIDRDVLARFLETNEKWGYEAPKQRGS